MSRGPLYFGGMILGSIEAAYEYEEFLANLLRQRIEMFDNPDTFWGRYRGVLIELEQKAKFPDEAYWYMPEDPLIAFPDIYWRVLFLKRRYLHRLKLKVWKLIRQRRIFGDKRSRSGSWSYGRIAN